MLRFSSSTAGGMDAAASSSEKAQRERPASLGRGNGSPRGAGGERGRGRGGGRGGRGGRGAGRGGKDRRANNPRVARRSAAVVYDPAAHTEYVTGFRKRKQARRLEAQSAAAAAEKESIRAARREKRAVLRDAARRARGEVPDGDFEDGDEEAEKTEVQEYAVGEGDAVVTTVISKIESKVDTSFIKSRIGNGAPVKREYSRKNPLPKELKPSAKIAKVKLKKKALKGSKAKGVARVKGKKGSRPQSRMGKE